MLHNLHQRRDLAVEHAGGLRQALLLADGHVVALVDAFRMEDGNQGFHQLRLDAVHAETEDLDGEIVSELVHRQAGQAVRLSEDHAAGVGEAEAPAVIPGRLQTAAEKALIYRLVFVPGQNADRDL